MLMTSRIRRPNRLHLYYVILDMLSDRQWYSARQFAMCMYYSRGTPHSQQIRYVRARLDASVAKCELIRNDTIARCPLYCAMHKSPMNNTGWVFHHMYQQYPEEWKEDQLMAMLVLMNDLNRFVPHTPVLKKFQRNGRLPVSPPTTSPLNPYPLGELPEPGKYKWL